jgi:integrase
MIMSRALGQKSTKRVIPRQTTWEIIESLNVRNAAMVAMLHLTGGRDGEVLALTREDLRREEDFMMVNLLTEKRQEKDIHRLIPVPLCDEFMEPVAKYVHTVKSGLLFPITTTRCWQICKEHGFHPHEWRHTRLTEVAPYFANDMDIDRFAGWKFPGMKATYVHLRMDHLKDPLRCCSYLSDTTKKDRWLKALKLAPIDSEIWKKYPQYRPYGYA